MIFRAIHPNTSRELGFIRFSNNGGTVELANYNARLSGKTLGLGYTLKAKQPNLAGTHGEGYKLTCLTMVRNNYTRMFEASSADWKFKISGYGKRNEGYWCCKLNRVTDEKIKDRKNAHRPPFKTRVWADVYVKIGGGKLGYKIQEEEFKQWIKQALDLDPPSKVINTKKGSLILDERLSNNLYLKGLLLERSQTAKSFKFGYDLAEGEIDRDRKTMSDPEEQGTIVAEIWAEAIKKDGVATLATYFEMLQDGDKWQDVEFAEDSISDETAITIRQHLRDQDPENNKFYYDGQDSEKVRSFGASMVH